MSGTPCVDQALDCATTADSGNFVPSGRKKRHSATLTTLKLRQRREVTGSDGADSKHLILKNECPAGKTLEKIDEKISICKQKRTNETEMTEMTEKTTEKPEDEEKSTVENFFDGVSEFLNLPGSSADKITISMFFIFFASLIRF